VAWPALPALIFRVGGEADMEKVALELLTVTLTALEVVVAPALSVALAVKL
jgi:hypothetical protein